MISVKDLAKGNLKIRKSNAEKQADLNLQELLKNDEIRKLYVTCKSLMVDIAKADFRGEDSTKLKEKYAATKLKIKKLVKKEKLLDGFRERFKNIVLLYDSDLTGVRFMNKIRKQHRDLIVCMIPRKYEAKDISDFYKKYGRSKTISLIKESINYIKREKDIA